MKPFNPEASLTDNLKANGYTHRPATKGFPGERDVVDSAGAVVFTGRYEDVARWLRDKEATNAPA